MPAVEAAAGLVAAAAGLVELLLARGGVDEMRRLGRRAEREDPLMSEWSKTVSSANVLWRQLARAPEAMAGWPGGRAAPWECRAARSRQARAEEAQGGEQELGHRAAKEGQQPLDRGGVM